MADKKKKIKACLVADYMGSMGRTPEQEAAAIKENYEEELKHPLHVELVHSPEQIPVGTEIVFFDYGGMLPGADDLIRHNCRYILKWAQDNPSALVVIVSTFTWNRYVRDEAEEMGLVNPEKAGGMFDEEVEFTIPNIVVQDCAQADTIPEWWKAGLNGR